MYNNNSMLTWQCNTGMSVSAKQPSSMKNTQRRIQSSSLLTVKRWLWETKGVWLHTHTPCSLWSCYLVIISHPGWRGIGHRRGGQTFIRDVLQALDLQNLLIIWRWSWKPSEKKVLEKDNSWASPQRKMLLSKVSCKAMRSNLFISCKNKTSYPGRGRATLWRNIVLYPPAIFLTDVWQLKIRPLLYYIACIGPSPKDTSIQTLAYIKMITGHSGLYINRNNGQT